MASTASIDDDSMDAATSDDRDLVRKACTYITEGAYPAGATANEKRVIRKKAKRFAVRNGELFYRKILRGRSRVLKYYDIIRYILRDNVKNTWLMPCFCSNKIYIAVTY